jgi:hypothetical protein
MKRFALLMAAVMLAILGIDFIGNSDKNESESSTLLVG